MSSIPVGFVSDHVEILFDIDRKAAAVAADLGMRLERPPALNDDPVSSRRSRSSFGTARRRGRRERKPHEDRGRRRRDRGAGRCASA